MNQLVHFFSYYLRKRPYWSWFIILIVAGTVIYFTQSPRQIFHNDDLNTWLGLFGTALAVYILVVSLRNEWVQELPKKLTVHFICNGKYAISVLNAPLLSKDDIRNWAQQLGFSMNEQKYLDLKFFELREGSHITREAGVMYEFFELNYYIGGKDLKNLNGEYRVRAYYDASVENSLPDYNYEEKNFGPHRKQPITNGETTVYV